MSTYCTCGLNEDTVLQRIVFWPAEKQAPGVMYLTDGSPAETFIITQENQTNVKAATICTTVWM